MKERMQKPLSQVNGCPQRNRSETEWYGGVQTFMWMCEDNIVEVPFDKEHLFEQILSPANLNRAYKAVMRNKGCGGIDKMSCEQLLPWLLTNKDELIRSLMDGSYRPNPVKRVEIPKDNGKMRLLGIPTVVDRLVQQAINQVLPPIYENQFSKTSYGFRPRRGCHDALRGAQRIISEGYLHLPSQYIFIRPRSIFSSAFAVYLPKLGQRAAGRKCPSQSETMIKASAFYLQSALSMQPVTVSVSTPVILSVLRDGEQDDRYRKSYKNHHRQPAGFMPP